MKSDIVNYIKTWQKRCYSDGIPDEAPYELEIRGKVPSYRLLCMVILKNDYSLKQIGLSRKKSKYYSELKRIELTKNGKIKQLRLPL